MKNTKNNLIGALVLVAGASSAMASTVTFDLGNLYTGTSPALAGPWLRATFTDTSTDNVQLTITRLTGSGTGMSTGEFIRDFYFNTTLGAGVSTLGIARTSGPGGVSFARSDNGINGAAGYNFDVRIRFTASNNANRFDESWTSAVFSLTRTGLTASVFNALASGNGPDIHVGAHLQGYANGDSGHAYEGVLVPTPSAALAGFGMLAGMSVFTAARRRRLSGN